MYRQISFPHNYPQSKHIYPLDVDKLTYSMSYRYD